MNDIEAYAGREQAYVKHELLRRYLQRLFYKICTFQRSISYVDAFAGPYQSSTTSLSDTSPHVAVSEWKAALIGLGKRGVPRADVKCLFIEKGLAKSKLLRASFAEERDISIEIRRGRFDESIDDIMRFAAGRFTFFFIDPTGWRDISITTLGPILAHEPGEVLINLMTGYLTRFANDRRTAIRASIDALFPNQDWRSELTSVSALPTEEAIATVYSKGLKEASSFRHVLWTPVMDPVADRIKYHLIYATRHIEGLRVFRDTEQHTFPVQSGARSTAMERQRLVRTQQLSLIHSDENANDPYLFGLRQRYLGIAKQSVLEMLRQQRDVPFDLVEVHALSLPFVWMSDVKGWCAELQSTGQIRIDGLKPRARRPQRNERHRIVWVGD